MDQETLKALKATWEMERAETLQRKARFDALVLLLCDEMDIDYEEFMERLRAATKVVIDHRLIELEDQNPSFAARVRGWLDREIRDFPLDQ